MTDAETRLAEFWDATASPANELAFALALEARLARRLMLIDLAVRAAAVVVAIVVLAFLAQPLAAQAAVLAPQLDTAGPALAALVVLGAVMLRLGWPWGAWPARETEATGDTTG